MPIESVMPSNHLILCHPLLLLPSILPSIRAFSMSQFFASGGHSIGASTSVLTMNIQDWSLLGWTGWISLQSKGLSRVFSNTTVQKHNTSALSFLYGPTLISIHMTNGKIKTLAKWTFVGKVMCSDFGAQENKVSLFPLFPHLFAMKWWDQMPWFLFSECWVLSQLFHSSFTFIKRLFSSSSLSAIRVVSSAYLRLLIFLPAIFIPACTSSSQPSVSHDVLFIWVK